MNYLEYGKAICYSGYRKGQSPKGDSPTKEQVREDLHILVNDGYKYIRMYDPNRHARYALEVIREDNLPLRCIIGIDSDSEVNNRECPFEVQNYTDEELKARIERNDREVDKLIDLVKEFDEYVVAVSVGNENTPVWTAHKVSEQRLIGHARKLKANLDKPVTFCEGALDWPNITDLAKELDIISVHSYPYHYGTPIEEAVAVNKEHYAAMKALFPDKQVIFTEVGWSSNSTSPSYNAFVDGKLVTITPKDGEPRRQSVDNEKRYIEELNSWLEEDKVIAFIFEAFDELWKGDVPEASECNFGLYNEERRKKF